MRYIILFIFAFISIPVLSQETLSELLKKYNSESIPYISVQELAISKTDIILLDAREENEYNVSHIEDATYVGYNTFKIETVVNSIENKNAKIVVYCSLGVRSEDIGEKLKKAGFTNVSNLYGGIFEWKNTDFKVYDTNHNETEKVHAFNKEWGEWLNKGVKVYE